MGKRPKEDPADKAARLRERRISEIERDKASQGTAGDLTADLRAVYGLRGMPLMFGSSAGVATPSGSTLPKWSQGSGNGYTPERFVNAARAGKLK